MKRFAMLAILLVFALVLTGCCLKHDWVEADCEDPKHCTKCDKTEGEALGHEWMDATCENPKTCERCDETKGEALGHNYGAWSLSGQDEMARTCSVCNGEERTAADRELIGRQFLMGNWYCSAMMDYDVGEWDFFDDPIFFAEFREDGTVTLDLFDPEEGTLVFDGYDAADDEYSFSVVTADGSSYGFDYVHEDDNLFTFGSGLALAWEQE